MKFKKSKSHRAEKIQVKNTKIVKGGSLEVLNVGFVLDGGLTHPVQVDQMNKRGPRMHIKTRKSVRVGTFPQKSDWALLIFFLLLFVKIFFTIEENLLTEPVLDIAVLRQFFLQRRTIEN